MGDPPHPARPAAPPPPSAGPPGAARAADASSGARAGDSEAAEERQREIAAISRALGFGPLGWMRSFGDLRLEWRRWFAEALGTFFLVFAGAGSAVVRAIYPGEMSAPAHFVVPAIMVMALILAIGALSGAHFNPVVTIGFLLRREFPLRRVPIYLIAQLIGGYLACLVVRALIGSAGHLGATLPGPGVSDAEAMGMEALLTFGLLTVILGTASGAQNVGSLSALAVGGYIAIAGIGFGPISGASMNPVRSLAPDLVRGAYAHLWPYFAGPAIGMLAAVVAAILMRGAGGDATAALAAQGNLGGPLLRRLEGRLSGAGARGTGATPGAVGAAGGPAGTAGAGAAPDGSRAAAGGVSSRPSTGPEGAAEG
jgi:aquaporin Z